MYRQKTAIRQTAKTARHERIRKKISGTPERPRLCVRRSLKNIYAQLVDDTTGKSLLLISSLSPELKPALQGKKKLDASRELGKLVAQKAKEKGIQNVVFDRGGYLFHGRVKAVAEAAREGGLNF
jgi:large subunit ribosomal protein L18